MYFFLPALLYAILLAPYISVIPGNDGSLELMLAYRWLLNDNRFQLLSLHPPFKYVLFSLFSQHFGYANVGYLGVIFGIAGIVALYFIAKRIFDTKVALISSFLLATSGLYVSVGIFSIHDFLITVFILIAFLSYLHSKSIWYVLFTSCAVLTKETALFFPVSILIYEIFIKKKITLNTFLPIVVFVWYLEYLHFSGNHLWNDWNFSPTAKKGSMYTMMNNIITLRLFNQYAYENWLHLFVFNFIWVDWLFAAISCWYIKVLKTKDELYPIGIFFLFYVILVLSFQTFTINRYILPLLPFLYMFTAYGISQLRWQPVFIIILFIFSFLSLTQSLDPISNLIWPKTKIFNESFYLNPKLDGYDGITYNMQYLTLMKERTFMLKIGECKMPHEISYDKQLLALLKINSCK